MYLICLYLYVKWSQCILIYLDCLLNIKYIMTKLIQNLKNIKKKKKMKIKILLKFYVIFIQMN